MGNELVGVIDEVLGAAGVRNETRSETAWMPDSAWSGAGGGRRASLRIGARGDDAHECERSSTTPRAVPDRLFRRWSE